MGVLKKAMNDSNRNVAAAVIRLCASLCSSIGSRFSSAGRPLVAPIIKAASDMKPAVQSAVAEFATSYIMQVLPAHSSRIPPGGCRCIQFSTACATFAAEDLWHQLYCPSDNLPCHVT